MKFCKECNELWCIDESSTCPRSLHDDNEREMMTLEALEKLSSVSPYNKSDKTCDELCFHTFKVLEHDICRHDMSFCPRCYRVWDGCAQCPCWLECDSNSDSDIEVTDVKRVKTV